MRPAGRPRRTAVALALSAALAATGSVSASFSATTANPGNSISTGTVSLSDNDSGAALMTSALDGNLAPGRSSARCVQVTYTGSVPAQVRLYASGTSPALASFLVKVETGSGLSKGFPRCNGFVPGAEVRATTPGDAMPSGWETGDAAKPGGGTWSTGEQRSYRVTVTAVDDASANARRTPVGTGAVTFTFEARSA